MEQLESIPVLTDSVFLFHTIVSVVTSSERKLMIDHPATLET